MAEEMKTVDFNLDSSEDQTAPTEEMTTVDFNLESAEKPTDSEKMTTVDIDLTNNESNTYEGWLTESAEGIVEVLLKYLKVFSS